MDFKHFTHNHGLLFHQLPQGTQIHCSGCKSPGSGIVYVCWQCNHFLHEQCYHATRSLKHPSHPPHPLTLMPYPTYPSGSFICNSCTLVGNGLSYTCSECQFDMHVNCALVPTSRPHESHFSIPNDAHNYNLHSQNPHFPPYNNTQNFSHHTQTPTYPPNQNHGFPMNNQHDLFPPPFAHSNTPPLNYSHSVNAPYMNSTYNTVVNPTTTNPPKPPPSYPTPPQPNNPQLNQPSFIKHFSHPHALTKLEVDPKTGKICSACESKLSGTSYCCIETHCPFNLHKSCFDAPLEVRHKSHLSHPLMLVTTPPYADGFTCNACLKEGKAFAYACATCSYDLHIDCVSWPEKINIPDHEHNLTLYYSNPAAQTSQDMALTCDVCTSPVHELAWIYYCRECDFGTHLECVASGINQNSVSNSGISETEVAALQMLFAALGQNAALNAV